jgi:hypothetical protein
MSKNLIDGNTIKEFEDGTMEVTITFNPFAHGHKLGKSRDYNKTKYIEMVSNKETQMHIKNGYALGGYTHDIRDFDKGTIKSVDEFGVRIVPSCKTISMEWLEDGLVRHTQRILNTDEGNDIQKLIKSGIGGFSSAHDLNRGKFYGFDYVAYPNFTTNRVIVDNTCKDGMCGLNFDSVERASENELRKTITNTLLRDGYIADGEIVEALENLEMKTGAYKRNILLLDEMKKSKMDMLQKEAELQHNQDETIKQFQDKLNSFIENDYNKLVMQLDSLGFEIDSDNNINPTSKTLGNLFKPLSFDDAVKEQKKDIEQITIRKTVKPKVGIFRNA